MENTAFDFGMIGLGVMGQNLLLNIADHHFSVIGYDNNPEKGKALEAAATQGTTVKSASSLENFVQSLATPRKIMMLVPAGKPVDSVIHDLVPLLSRGDIIIDGGNSHFRDTLRRVESLREQGFHFMGMGVSGGEKGARTGPSIMPGGDKEAYAEVQPILEAVAAKASGEPCVAYMGKGAAGHFVKMVHNGIEYAIMQLIAEVYDLMHKGLQMSNDEMHQVFRRWNEGDLQSFLIEITSAIFLQPDEFSDNRLLDMISDKAGAKGTGKWTSQEALNLGTPVPTIDIAVNARNISALQAERKTAAEAYDVKSLRIPMAAEVFTAQLEDALYFGIVTAYAQGLAMLQVASRDLEMEIPLPQVVKIWRAGCIIRSVLLDQFFSILEKQPDLSNIMLDEDIVKILRGKEQNIRSAVINALSSRIPAAGLASAVSYFDAYSTERLSSNMIQAQRDFFGAHTYERTDRSGSFHTHWNGE